MANIIRADFDATTIVVYQAFPPSIALSALRAQRFVAPFSMTRMSWIKPSFLWLMERSNWGKRSGQECILAIRMTRTGWEEALAAGVLTHPEPSVYPDPQQWRNALDHAVVQIQWDPERSLRGASLSHGSIQVGLSRHILHRYVYEWIVGISDHTPTVRKLDAMIRSGNADRAARLLPPARDYPLEYPLARRIAAHVGSG